MQQNPGPFKKWRNITRSWVTFQSIVDEKCFQIYDILFLFSVFGFRYTTDDGWQQEIFDQSWRIYFRSTQPLYWHHYVVLIHLGNYRSRKKLTKELFIWSFDTTIFDVGWFYVHYFTDTCIFWRNETDFLISIWFMQWIG